MASNIDASKPNSGNALTADVRQNFAIAKAEIEDLQATKPPADVTAFTPVAAGVTTPGAGTYGSQIGHVQKTGKLVHFQLQILWTAHTGTGDIEITGLPHVFKTGAAIPVFDFNTGQLAVGSGKIPLAYGNPGTSSLRLAIRDVLTNANTPMPMQGSSGTISISGHYFTD